MKEDFLQWLWEHQLFDHEHLTSTTGEPIRILEAGHRNTFNGPDFSHARIYIGSLLWVGSVEIHTRTRDWDAHGHSPDPHYQKVILHVVWEHKGACPNDIPVMELKGRVPLSYIHRFRSRFRWQDPFPCYRHVSGIPELIRNSMLDACAVTRMERRFAQNLEKYQQLGGDLEAYTWNLLLHAFGLGVNAGGFEALAKTCPYNLIRKVSAAQLDPEALLLGCAGFLTIPEVDDHTAKLKAEFLWMINKYGIRVIPGGAAHWRTGGIRPANAPSLRIAQLASLVRSKEPLQVLSQTKEEKKWKNAFEIGQTDYWRTHYRLGFPVAPHAAVPGSSFIHQLILNVYPLAKMMWDYQYGCTTGGEEVHAYLESLPPEENTIVRRFQTSGWPIKSAADSQAILELNEYYCSEHRCLRCKVGAYLLNKE